jgi:hypothetical protein
MIIQADGAGITAFRGMKSLPPAPLLNFIVRRRPHMAPSSALSRCTLSASAFSYPVTGP